MSVLLLVCLFQASVMWRFIHFQLRRWREYWHEQSSRKRAAACAKQPAKPLKRDSGEQGALGNGLPRLLWVPAVPKGRLDGAVGSLGGGRCPCLWPMDGL